MIVFLYDKFFKNHLNLSDIILYIFIMFDFISKHIFDYYKYLIIYKIIFL